MSANLANPNTSCRPSSVIAMLLLAFCGFSLFWLFVIEEFAVGPRIPLFGYLLMSAAVFAVAGLLRWKVGWGVAAAYLVLLALLWFFPTSRKQFLRDLSKLSPGMSKGDVMNVMGKYPQGTGWPATYGTNGSAGTLSAGDQQFGTAASTDGQLQIVDSIVFRHDLKEADWGVVEMKSNRVVCVSFLPD